MILSAKQITHSFKRYILFILFLEGNLKKNTIHQFVHNYFSKQEQKNNNPTLCIEDKRSSWQDPLISFDHLQEFSKDKKQSTERKITHKFL